MNNHLIIHALLALAIFAAGGAFTIGIVSIHSLRAESKAQSYMEAFEEVCPQLKGLQDSLPDCIACHYGCSQ